MRYVLPPWVAVPVGILTLACAAVGEAFGISQAGARAGLAVGAGILTGALVVWLATGLVLDEPFVLPPRERAWLTGLGTAMALAAALGGLKESNVYAGMALVLPLGVVWGLVLSRTAQQTAR